MQKCELASKEPIIAIEDNKQGQGSLKTGEMAKKFVTYFEIQKFST